MLLIADAAHRNTYVRDGCVTWAGMGRPPVVPVEVIGLAQRILQISCTACPQPACALSNGIAGQVDGGFL